VKQNLNLETEIIVKEGVELEEAKAAGEYEAVRRGIVLPTADETANFLAIFHSDASVTGETTTDSIGLTRQVFRIGQPTPHLLESRKIEGKQSIQEDATILSEEDALYELRAIPLYFPTSYSLAKGYVKGFDSNILDSPSLKDVEIDSDWRTK